MKILLFNPPYSTVYGQYSPGAKLGNFYPPLGLMYLAAALIKDNHEVKLIDLEAEQWKEKQIIQFLQEFKPKLVGLTSSTPTHHIAREIITIIKKTDPSIITIIGGPHTSSLPKDVMKFKNLDYAIVGEGEIAITKLARNIEDNKPNHNTPGLVFRSRKGIKVNQPELIENLDTIPFPARHLLDSELYRFSVPGGDFEPVTPIATTRGCCFNCTFCAQSKIFGRKVRARSVKNVMEEIEDIYFNHQVRYLVFEDDTFGLDKKRTYELLDAMIDSKLDIKAECMTRANLVDREFLEKMKEAGIVRISFGLESGNQEILNNVRKGTKLEDYQQAYKLANEAGMETRTSVIFGLPGETKQTIKNTLRFLKKLDCYQVYINIATPFPGTELYYQALNREYGMQLLSLDWKDYRRWGGGVLQVNDLGPKELQKWQRRGLLEFYLRPKIIKYNLFKRSEMKANLRNAVAFLKSFIGAVS